MIHFEQKRERNKELKEMRSIGSIEFSCHLLSDNSGR
jgi:hypothetical protein